MSAEPEVKMSAAPEEKIPSLPGEKEEPAKPMQIPNKEWDMCVQKAVKTVGFGVVVGAVLGFLVGADLPLMWGTGLTVAWSIKRCRALLRDGIITPEMEKERKRLAKLEREKKKLEQIREKEEKSKMDHECCRRLAELEEIMLKDGRLDSKSGGERKTRGLQEEEKLEFDRSATKAAEESQNDKQPKFEEIDGDSDDCELPENNQQDTETWNDTDDDEGPCDGMESDTLEDEGECTGSPDGHQNTQDEHDCEVYENEETEDCENEGKLEGKIHSTNPQEVKVEEECDDDEEPEDCTEPEMEKMGEFYGEEPCEYEDEEVETSTSPPASTGSYNSFLQRPSTSRAAWSHDAFENRGSFLRAKKQHVEYPVTVLVEGQLFGSGKPKTNAAKNDPLVQRGFHDRTESVEEECEEEEEDETMAEKAENFSLYDDEDESVEDLDATLSEDDLDSVQRDVQILGFNQTNPKSSNELQNDALPFPMSLPSLENFHKKPKSSFKWPPLTSSIIVKPKRQPVCSCEMHKYSDDQMGDIKSD